MNVFVIAPHPDDEAIGCGGTLRLHAERGDRVFTAFLTSGEAGLRRLSRDEARRTREAEARSAAQVLGMAGLEFLRGRDWFLGDCVDGMVEQLAPLLRREQPRVVFLPHQQDAHPDHRVTHEIYHRAAELAGVEPPAAIFAYEVWSPLRECNHVVDVTRVMAWKLRAVRCHATQLEQFRYDQAIRGLNRYRGALLARFRFAEAFLDLANPGGEMNVGLMGNE